ncbi:MAG: hypothetical protein WKG07_27990 [Hymenobacter sp.]
MPDIDIDFDDVNRQKVIDYVVEKYGKNAGGPDYHLRHDGAPKASIKDVARAMELPLPAANEIAKLVPEKPGTTLAGAFADVPELDTLSGATKPDDLKGQILAPGRAARRLGAQHRHSRGGHHHRARTTSRSTSPFRPPRTRTCSSRSSTAR